MDTSDSAACTSTIKRACGQIRSRYAHIPFVVVASLRERERYDHLCYFISHVFITLTDSAFVLSKVPERYRAQREQRDGRTHHITIIAKHELATLQGTTASPTSPSRPTHTSPSTLSPSAAPPSGSPTPSPTPSPSPEAAISNASAEAKAKPLTLEAVLRQVYAVPDDWRVLGVGKATQDDNEAYDLSLSLSLLICLSLALYH